MRVFTQSEQYLLREGFIPPQKGVFLWEEQIYPKKKLFALDSGVTLMDLFNPTLGRDASHFCLISIEPKEGCTNHVWYWARLKNYELCMIALPYFFKSRGRWGFPLKPQKAHFLYTLPLLTYKLCLHLRVSSQNFKAGYWWNFFYKAKTSSSSPWENPWGSSPKADNIF